MLADPKRYLRTNIYISNCYSQSILKFDDVNKERFFLGKMKDLWEKNKI